MESPCPPAAMENVLLHIEDFLLPTIDDRYQGTNLKRRSDFSSSPHSRLDHVLFQVALADHIRTLQIMYRDSEDFQNLAIELREGDTSVKLPTKNLMEKITEGRSRAVALCRSCYGDDSLESLRASVDLASSYALGGMWAQVSESIAMSSQLIISKTNRKDQIEQHERQEQGKRAAIRVNCCYGVLRAHAIRFRGQITSRFLIELHGELSHLSSEQEDLPQSDVSVSALNYATNLTTELHEFFDQFIRNKRKTENISDKQEMKGSEKSVPSWGDVVNYLRAESQVMQNWMREVEDSMLPQNKAALHLPFRQCDDQKKGVAHPAQLAATFMKFSHALKVMAGTTLLKQLKDLKIEVPILIDTITGFPVDMAAIDENQQELENGNHMSVVYELPVTWEEVLCRHAAEVEGDPLELLKAQVFTLLGVSQVFSNKLLAAEDNLKNAVKQLEKLGLEMEVSACELYNSIAQLMITKHRQREGQRKVGLKREAIDWLLGMDRLP